MIRFSVLGSLQVFAGDQCLRLEGRKRRLMLAVMLVHANEVVSIDRLADAVWGDQRPSRALPSMRNIIAEFRSLIGRECFETRPPWLSALSRTGPARRARV
jgi:DNA-binding SARP family transcriptional activator